MPMRLVRGRLLGGEVAERGEHLGLGPAGGQVERASSVRIEAGTVWSSRSVERVGTDRRRASRASSAVGRADVARAKPSSTPGPVAGKGSGAVMLAAPVRVGVVTPPLSSAPESFTRRRPGLSPSASRARDPGRAAFQRCLARPVRWPERFRGGCSFGAARIRLGCVRLSRTGSSATATIAARRSRSVGRRLNVTGAPGPPIRSEAGNGPGEKAILSSRRRRL